MTLAPGDGGRFVTSETGTVEVVNPEARIISVRMDDDHQVRILEERKMAADRLTQGCAVTVHRSQGSTVERAHALADGGGRELTYVKMAEVACHPDDAKALRQTFSRLDRLPASILTDR